MRFSKLEYILSTGLFGFLAVLFLLVLITSLGKNAVDMCVRVGFNWRHEGNYVGLIAGFISYGVFLLFLLIPRLCMPLPEMMPFIIQPVMKMV